jgi:ASC-1-like (ASCH) protein
VDHVAILRKASISKEDNLLRDILKGTKTIESRWYVNRVSPWDKIKRNDTVYFKESGSPITAKANVAKVIQIDNLNDSTIRDIIKNYGKEISPGTTSEQWLSWAKKQIKKRYCILIFIKDVKRVTPFNIDKTGYGISSAWLAVGSIDKVRV